MACLAAALFVATTGFALAQAQTQGNNSPYYIGLSENIVHDSNLYRLSDTAPAPTGGASRADTTYTSMAFAGFEQTLGRQRLRGDASLSAVRFGNNSALNHAGYNLKLGWDWSTVERLSGNVNAHADKALVRSNNDALVANPFGRNMVTSQGFDGTVRLGMVTRWTLEAGFAHQRADYSALSYAGRDYRQSSLAVGLRYAPSTGLNLGAALRRTEGEFPKITVVNGGPAAADRYSGSNLDLTARWVPSTASQLDARLSWGNTTFERSTGNNLSGFTGYATWGWRPTGKLRIETRLARERGQDITALELFAVGRSVDVSRTSTALLIGATQELTGKINLVASVGGSNRDLADTRTTTTGASTTTTTLRGSDHSSVVSLGLRWAPTRSVQTGCDASSERRSTQSSLSTSYRTNTLGCFGRLTLQ